MNKTVILFDANILIDYQYERRYVIERLSDSGWHFIVVKDVLEEVEDYHSYDDFPMTVIRPTIQQRQEAKPKSKALSEQDLLCFVISRDLGIACATNDRRLRNELKRNNIPAYSSRSILDIANAECLLTASEYADCSNYFISVLKYTE